MTKIELDADHFVCYVQMMEDKLDGGERISREEVLKRFREMVVFVHENELEKQIAVFEDKMVGGYKIPAADFNIIEDFMFNSKKINAIKHMRAATGIGLKEAKNAVEEEFPSITAPIDNMRSSSGSGSRWPSGTTI